MVAFLSECPELARRESITSHVLTIRCLCLGHVIPILPHVALVSGDSGATNVACRVF